MYVQFHPMMPSATAIDPFIDLAITETLRPMIPESPTPRSRRCRNCITEKEYVWRGNERNGFAGDWLSRADAEALRSPSRLDRY